MLTTTTPVLTAPKPLAVGKKPQNPTAKFVIGAGVAWSYELALGHFFEFIKVMKQTQGHKSYLELGREITKAKGIYGIWDGFFPWGTVQAIAKGSVFSWGQAFARMQMVPLVKQGTLSDRTAEIISGGFGGGVQGIFLSPTLLLKTRVMTDPVFRNKMTGWETCKKSGQVGMNVIRHEGISALMKGSIVFSLKRVADWSTRYAFCVLTEEALFKGDDPKKKLTVTEELASSLIGGTLSCIATLPVDVMVAQIQQASKAGANVGIISTFKDEYAKGGMKRLVGFSMAGFIPRCLHCAFTTMVMKTGCSVVYDMYEQYTDAN
ncbi:hypothetical protein SDRG_06986 [Saprolegnia diclina VS20]|uniref:Uncharacterized protein n=1 Tax=Saprolegnia diclina (strain VS20) TaxID=1156394 RepID=T0QLV2_SAPDV|nr:hypothetical protein SDRG_06986 [Saprolegnia diclina VS20]EQC35706.1 hypothetical protein SDRG_06986 [Saprolegnia diclina VS20]|eukprot:XP_008611023.1 hypothetical protein SDRG_06986 [Saprolegnia diclina VS20]